MTYLSLLTHGINKDFSPVVEMHDGSFVLSSPVSHHHLSSFSSRPSRTTSATESQTTPSFAHALSFSS